MMKKTVKYQNNFNLVSLSSLTETENNLLMTIVAQLQYQGTNRVVLEDLEVAKLIAPTYHMTRKQIIDMEISLWDKISEFKIDAGDRYSADGGYTRFNFLSSYRREDGNHFSVSVAEEFVPLFNDYLRQNGFTLFQLKEYLSLSGTYCKQLYRSLKQWRQVGRYFVTIADFRKIYGVPDSYQTKELTRRVIDPAVNYLAEHIPEFSSLTWMYAKTITAGFEPVPIGRGRAAKPNYVYFQWTPEIVEADAKEREIKKMLDKTLGKDSLVQKFVTYDGESPDQIRERKTKEYRKPALERQLEKAKQEADQSLDFRKDSGEE